MKSLSLAPLRPPRPPPPRCFLWAWEGRGREGMGSCLFKIADRPVGPWHCHPLVSQAGCHVTARHSLSLPLTFLQGLKNGKGQSAEHGSLFCDSHTTGTNVSSVLPPGRVLCRQSH